MNGTAEKKHGQSLSAERPFTALNKTMPM